MTIFKKCTIAFFAMTTLSCSVKVSELSGLEQGKVKDCPLDVYHDANNIKRKYEVICLVDSKTSYSLYQSHTGSEAIKMAGFKACKYGADGMIVISSGKTKFNFWGTRGVAKLKAIKYLE
ncbi:hypothetical protein [Dyadobacter sp. CY326]|uniref:hypothetical protein n=1 Tax=Dyadobacter sp. CY326 TaxID=2907300 RepID=UPI001F467C8A|nr:hypothetical protein [Dyadobacter sp. CY326]MCE7065174.1 hypothetical protein [Dyadobacter sp. CY326]